jgi:protocatechuate 3,4-dioxygenase beta subunit
MVLTRRDLLRYIGATPFIVACAHDGTGALDGGADLDATPDSPALGPWAIGGTAAMTDKATYPDPFTTAATSCMIVAGTTDGPCTTTTELARVDVSEGWTGLPVRLAMRFVTAACAPIAGAVVKIWHTSFDGSYSGVTPNPAMCLKQQSYSTADFFRGVQTTDANGIVYFDTCFPGWYPGRAIHIHVQVASKVSQLFFPEILTTDIFANHSEYKTYGQPDTTFANDNVMAGIPQPSRASNIVEWARMTDGAMLASKTITVM